MDLKNIGDSIFCSVYIRYYCIILLVAFLIYIGDVYLLKKDCKIDPLLSNGYVIKTPGCSIPNYLTYSVDDVPYRLKPLPYASCSNGLPKFLISNLNYIYINEKLFHNTSWNIEKFKCDYRPCSNNDVYNECLYVYPLHRKAKIDDLFVLVNCSYGTMKNFYHDFFTFLPNITTANKTQNKDFLNVIVWGLEGVSRLGFHRQMKKTSRLMRRLDAIEFFGYNNVGDDSFSNIMPVLSGLNRSEVLKGCLKKCEYYDDCPLVFKDFKEKGYLTSFAEDGFRGSLFDFRNAFGFKKYSTDFFWSPYHMKISCKRCIGRQSLMTTFLEYSKKLLDAMQKSSRKFFAMFWSQMMTLERSGDENLASFLCWLNRTGVLNNTIFILMSDRGSDFGSMRLTPLGSIENRLPILYVYLPRWYKIKLNVGLWYISDNTRRLVTPFDIHETLLDLQEPFVAKRRKVKNPSTKRGFSLFDPISINRTCSDAQISPHRCTCVKFKDVNAKDGVSVQAANYASMFVEIKSKNIKGNVTKILTNRLHMPLSDFNANRIYEDYTVLFRMSNRSLNFEATVRKLNKFNANSSFAVLNFPTKLSGCECCNRKSKPWYPPTKSKVRA